MLKEQLSALIDTSAPTISNLANAAAFLWHELNDISWIGFYLVKDETLCLGPFAGKPACIKIPFGKGVCGTCAKTKEIQIVGDVHKFPGHIACDSASNSEIVIPILLDGKLQGVLDIDSTSFHRFDENDSSIFNEICSILASKCNWDEIC